jgi:hypothetical protein
MGQEVHWAKRAQASDIQGNAKFKRFKYLLPFQKESAREKAPEEIVDLHGMLLHRGVEWKTKFKAPLSNGFAIRHPKVTKMNKSNNPDGRIRFFAVEDQLDELKVNSNTEKIYQLSILVDHGVATRKTWPEDDWKLQKYDINRGETIVIIVAASALVWPASGIEFEAQQLGDTPSWWLPTGEIKVLSLHV